MSLTIKGFDVTKALNNVKFSLIQNSPEILIGLGIAGLVGAAVMAVKATPEAMRLLKVEDDARFDEATMGKDFQTGVELDEAIAEIPEITPIEAVKLTYKCYIPAVLTGAVSIVCIVGANSINLKRNAALAAAYAISETTLKDYQDRVVATIGEKKDQEIRNLVAQKKVSEDPPVAKEVIITGKGTTLFRDGVSGRYFESDVDAVRKAASKLDHELWGQVYISLNDFYDELGIDRSDLGDLLGWNEGDFIDVTFSSAITPDERPCLVMEYSVAPRYGYGDLH